MWGHTITLVVIYIYRIYLHFLFTDNCFKIFSVHIFNSTTTTPVTHNAPVWSDVTQWLPRGKSHGKINVKAPHLVFMFSRWTGIKMAENITIRTPSWLLHWRSCADSRSSRKIKPFWPKNPPAPQLYHHFTTQTCENRLSHCRKLKLKHCPNYKIKISIRKVSQGTWKKNVYFWLI